MILKIEYDYRKWIHQENRFKSNEIDYACCWGLREMTAPFWRVSLIEKTGELYATCPRDNTYILIGKFKNKEEVDKKLKGWFDDFEKLIITKWFGEIEELKHDEILAS